MIEAAERRKIGAMGFKAAGRSGSGEADVDQWLATKNHPQAALMQATRAVILAADSRVGECVKWSCPTFTFNGNIVSFNPHAKAHLSLMFHTGGKIPVALPQLVGDGAVCKYMRIQDLSDLAAQKAKLVEVVKAWCAWKS